MNWQIQWLWVAIVLFPAPSTAFAQPIYSWGYNSYGQLGIGTNTISTPISPVNTSGVLNGVSISQVAIGGTNTLALGGNGRVYSWGDNGVGQLGNANNSVSNVPVAVVNSGVLNGLNVTHITAGQHHGIALANNGRVYTWGRNLYGQLGNAGSSNSNVPVAVASGSMPNGVSVSHIAAGGYHNLVLGSNGVIYTWGNNPTGQLGNASNQNSNIPVAVISTGVLNGQTVTQLAAGIDHSLALGNDGRVYSWGANNSGQLGSGSVSTSSYVPVAVNTSGVLNGITVAKIAASGNHCLALGTDGRIYSWGSNNNGQLGNNSTTASNVPVAVTSSLLNGLTVTQIAATGYNSYALTDTGRLFAWGDNNYGQLVQGAAGGSAVPVEIPAPNGFYFTGIAGGPNAVHVITTVAAVPEPVSLSMMGGLGMIVLVRRRRGRSL